MLKEKGTNKIYEDGDGSIKLVVSVSSSERKAEGTFSQRVVQEGGGSYDQPLGSLNITTVNKSLSFHQSVSLEEFSEALSLAADVVSLLSVAPDED